MDIRKIRAEMRMGRPIYDLPLRVTFYARVSTDQDEQLNSLENQVQYYTELIRSKKNWTFVPGYIDEGISGTSTKKRDEFNRMIRRCKQGKIDMIIAGMSPTEKRKMSIDFSDTYFDSNLVMVVRNDGAYASATSIQSFSGAKITAQLNTFHDTVVDQIPGVKHAMPMESFPV